LITDVLPAFAYTCVIFYAGLIRLPALPEVGFVPTDKALHAVTFGGLAVLLARAIRFFWRDSSVKGSLAWSACIASMSGALLELCQSFVPYRSAEFLDWFADTIGALAAVALFALIWPHLPRWARPR
jgi:VanZ family protein